MLDKQQQNRIISSVHIQSLLVNLLLPAKVYSIEATFKFIIIFENCMEKRRIQFNEN